MEGRKELQGGRERKGKMIGKRKGQRWTEVKSDVIKREGKTDQQEMESKKELQVGG